MLLDYGIDSQTYHVKDKTRGLSLLEFPCVIYWGGNFVVFVRKDNTQVFYYWNGLIVSQPLDVFEKYWSGIVMFINTKKESIEPDYMRHVLSSVFLKFFFLVSVLFIFVFFIHIGVGEDLYKNIYTLLLFVLNVMGGLISSLLLMKQLKISKYVDYVCTSLLNKSECGTVLDSNYSKFLNLFSWAELGVAYFISNIIIMIFRNDFIIYLSIINMLVLPYSFWSIWCQKYIIKQWCSLCLLTQLVLWLIFSINLMFHKIYIPHLHIIQLFEIGFVYVFMILVVNRVSVFIEKYRNLLISEQKFKSLKGIEDIFNAILKRESFYQIDKYQYNIIFQGLDSDKSIYYFTNPYCEPCASKHNEIRRYICSRNRHFSVKFIFLSFGDEYDDGSRCLIAVYFKYEQSKALSIYDEWFSKGKYNRESFIKKYTLDIYSDSVEQELAKHKNISKELNIYMTPYLLINGYAFPYFYEIEELVYF